MCFIDLHMHTSISDGTDSPERLINKAVRAKVKVLSITDHNSIEAYSNLEQVNWEDLNIRPVIGVELSACYNSMLVEILAYGFDLSMMRKYVQATYDPIEMQLKEKETFLKIKQRMQELNLKFDPDLAYEPPFCTQAFERELWKHPENLQRFPEQLAKYPELFYRYLNDQNSELYTFDAYYPSYEDVINAIHAAGGKAFLAHPYVYPVKDGNRLAIDVATTSALDGIEVFHSHHSRDNVNTLLDTTKRLNLLVSGGSDYHGKVKPYIQLGRGCGDLNVPEKFVNWVGELANSL